jgi:hypothetical protein
MRLHHPYSRVSRRAMCLCSPLHAAAIAGGISWALSSKPFSSSRTTISRERRSCAASPSPGRACRSRLRSAPAAKFAPLSKFRVRACCWWTSVCQTATGLDVIRETARRWPAVLIMVITVFGDELKVVSSIQSGRYGLPAQRRRRGGVTFSRESRDRGRRRSPARATTRRACRRDSTCGCERSSR